MEHKMHKAERQLSAADTMAILKKGDHGTLSVQGDDGYPYATPINYIIVDTKCVLPVTKVETTRVFKPDQVQDYDGYRINFRLYHDTIVPKNKIVGCYVSVGNTAGTSVANILSLANRAGNVANSFVVDAYFTQPAALRGDLLMNTTTAFKVGTKYQAGSTNIKVEVGKENVVEQSTNDAYFALVDSTGTALAVSNGKIALSKK